MFCKIFFKTTILICAFLFIPINNFLLNNFLPLAEKNYQKLNTLLSPESRLISANNNIQFTLKSYVRYFSHNILADSSTKKLDIFFNNNGNSVQLGLSKIISFKKKSKSLQKKINITIIPVLFNKKIFYAYLAVSPDDNYIIDIFISPLTEHLKRCSRILNNNTIGMPEEIRLTTDPEHIFPSYAALDTIDESVQISKKFLNSIFDTNIGKILETLSGKKQKLLIIHFPGLVISARDAIIIDGSLSKKEKAWQIIKEFLKKFDNGIPLSTLKKIQKKFDLFYKNPKTPGNIKNSVLSLSMESLNKKILSAFHEGHMWFNDIAFQEIPDTSDIKINSPLYQKIFKRIKEIFIEVANNEAERYKKKDRLWKSELLEVIKDIPKLENLWNNLIKENYIDKTGILQNNFLTLNTWRELKLKSDFYEHKEKIYNLMNTTREQKNILKFPIKILTSPDNIEVKHLSDFILPIAVLDAHSPKRKIFINNNFIKVMCKLHELGMATQRGDIYHDNNNPQSKKLGNLWESIIYSVAFHEIRGHFRIINNNIIFNPEEEWAQAERGGRDYIFMNTLAIMYFLFEIVEQDTNFNPAFLDFFVEKNPYLFRNLTDKEKSIFTKRLLQIYFDLADKNIVPVSKTGLTYRKTGKTRKDYEKLMCTYGNLCIETLFDFLLHSKKTMSFNEIADELGAWRLKYSLRIYIERLKQIGIITSSSNNQGETVYSFITIPGFLAKDAKKIIEGFNDLLPDDEKLKTAREKFFAILEPYRSLNLLKTIEKYSAPKTAREKNDKIVIAISPGWIPQIQRDSSQFSSLIFILKKIPNIEIIIGKEEYLVNTLKDLIENKKETSWGKIIIIAEKNALQTTLLKTLIPRENEKNKPFVVCVNTENIKPNSYIPITDIIKDSILAANNPDFTGSPKNIIIKKYNSRFIIFSPAAKALNIDIRNKIYKEQAKLLIAA
ncbi:hypothetical protein OMAG_001679 [Candidatus Omnitrophus magneticus]|uniref:Uncharacterized protein n=1 Tax=Candidatus Omnitrophus magneticus TaxID=1609969 RepID=A0A0F0CMA7_9BACT|nr:hypothetical protein OMAG_001679 [Candidatus Omnitrophus magneticus]